MNGAPSAMVSPGLWGFVAFFVLAVALYLLMRNMNARMRRMSYRALEREREAAADAAAGESRKSRESQESRLGEPRPGEPNDVAGDVDGDEGQTGEPRS